MTAGRISRFVPAIAIAALLAVFGLLADEVVEGDTMSFDSMVLMWFRTPGNTALPVGPLWLQEAVRDVTSLGSFSLLGIITLAVAVQLILSRHTRTALYLVSAVVGGTLVSTVLKIFFDRPRPDFAALAHVFTASFPSGHATLSAVVYLTIGAILADATAPVRLRVFYLGLAVLLTLLVGVSRVYMGVHYPTDVLAGWLLGGAWAILCWVGAQLLHVEGPEGVGAR